MTTAGTTRWLLACMVVATASSGRIVAAEPTAADGRLPLVVAGADLGTYVSADAAVLRPFIAGLRTPDGIQVTRHHPPRPGLDADDHATMHPGVWPGFGAVSGHDLWRNRGRIEHVRFTRPPAVADGQLRFATESRLLDEQGEEFGRFDQRIRIGKAAGGTLLLWEGTFHALGQPLEFGDQEEMGFGVRVATGLAEKDGGRLVTSAGDGTAATAWGTVADWCELAGTADGHTVSVTVLASPRNFRPAWWHVRAYGLAVANPFGRAALARGEPSRVIVHPGEPLRLGFGVLARATDASAGAEAWRAFLDAEAEELGVRPH